MTGHPLLQHIADRLDDLVHRCRPREASPGILVGFSGGPDSLALLLGARLWAARGSGTVEAAHLHHELRPGHADEDLEFCRQRCEDLGIRLHESRQDPRPVARRRGLGLEEAARSLRYEFLRRILDAGDRLHCVALGHHRDDQAETILMRLLRGTGPDGLRGMLPVRDDIIRPLLEIRRGDILACLQELGETWQIDTTNLEGDNLRARLRRRVIPVLNDVFGPEAHLRPVRAAELLADDLELLAEITDRALASVQDPDHPGDLDRNGLLALGPTLARRVLRAWLGVPAVEAAREGKVARTCGLVHLEAALAWISTGQSGTGLDLPGGIRLERVFDRLTMAGQGDPGAVRRDATDYRILVTAVDPPDDPPRLGRTEGAGEVVPGGWRLHCPAAALRGNLRVGHPLPGDRITPLGLEGSKKLSDLLREKRVPAGRRDRLLVVRDDQGVLWVVGLVRGERTRLLPRPGKIVTINVIERHPDFKRGT